MRKCILLSFLLLLLLPFVFYGWFSLTSGVHQYRKSDFFSYWLYTPDTLKDVPLISMDAEYSYDYDLDNQQTKMVVTWHHINNITQKKAELINFLQQRGPTIKYNCLWVYYDQHDYSDNYQRYCVSQKGDTLELEYLETVN